MGKVILLSKGGDEQLNTEITVFDVAKAFLIFNSMTHKKLQKLCYYAYAWYLVVKNQSLFDEKFQAWIHGPVCPELYQIYKKHGLGRISKEAAYPKSIENNGEIKKFIGLIYKMYGHLSAKDLEVITHNEDPWKNAREGLAHWEPGYEEISDEDIRRYYTKALYDAKN